MNIQRMDEILADCTRQFRKGEEIEGTPELVAAIRDFKDDDDPAALPGGTVHIYNMPAANEANDNLIKVDCHFIVVGVDKVRAEVHREELNKIINESPYVARFAAGPSYLEVGSYLGDQGAAFCFFALGKVLGLWDVITPATFSITGEQADMMAGNGFVMMSGYKAA